MRLNIFMQFHSLNRILKNLRIGDEMKIQSKNEFIINVIGTMKIKHWTPKMFDGWPFQRLY